MLSQRTDDKMKYFDANGERIGPYSRVSSVPPKRDPDNYFFRVESCSRTFSIEGSYFEGSENYTL